MHSTLGQIKKIPSEYTNKRSVVKIAWIGSDGKRVFISSPAVYKHWAYTIIISFIIFKTTVHAPVTFQLTRILLRMKKRSNLCIQLYIKMHCQKLPS